MSKSKCNSKKPAALCWGRGPPITQPERVGLFRVTGRKEKLNKRKTKSTCSVGGTRRKEKKVMRTDQVGAKNYRLGAAARGLELPEDAGVEGEGGDPGEQLGYSVPSSCGNGPQLGPHPASYVQGFLLHNLVNLV